MRVNHHIVKVFIRQALRDAGAWRTDPQDAVDALDAIALGNYTKSTDTDTTLIANSTAGQTFQFQVTPGLSRVQLMAHAEEAMEIIEKWIGTNALRTTPLSDTDLISAIRNNVLTRKRRARPSFC